MPATSVMSQHGEAGSSLSLAPTPLRRVFFALNARERDLFFTQPYKERDIEARWASEDELSSPQRWAEALEAWRPEILVSGWSTPPLPMNWLGQPDCPVRYVCHVTGSVRGIVPREFLERGGRITNWGNIAAREVAEHALLLALAALRKLPRWSGLRVEAGGPSPSALLGTRTLFHRSVGLHGFGSVARALQDLLSGFGVAVHAFSAGVPDALMREAEVTPCSSLKELFSRSEVLFECEALTPESCGSVTGEILGCLRDDAVFVNVARGQIADEKALLREAESGRIHVAVDVLNGEPPPFDPPFARLPNVIFSPHIAGPTFDTLPRCGDLALENLRRFLNDQPLEAEIDLEIYDRST